MDRRQFLAASAGIAALAPLAHADDAEKVPIIDAHQHLWDLRKFKLPWIKEASPLARNYLPEDYDAAVAGLNVVKAIYMEVDVHPDQQDEEAEFVIDLCKGGKTKTVAGVISGRPDTEGFAAYIRKYKDSPYIKGVRRVLHVPETPPGYCLRPEFVKGIKLLGELGLCFDLCIRPEELPNVAKLIGQCPGTRFVLDHCGNPRVYDKDRTEWKRGIDAIAGHDNVVCKVSGFIASAEKGEWGPGDIAPIVNHVWEAFGPDRVMFAGDWPVCTAATTFAGWVAALKTVLAGRTAAERRKFFHDNAARFYGLRG